MDKRIKILLLAIGIGLLVAIVSTTYAYFTISNKTGNEEVITSGVMSLRLADGSQITKNFIIPGEYIEKTFSVTNTGNIASSYDIYLSDVVNTFVDKTDLVYELTSNDGGYSTSTQVQVPSTSTKIIDSQPIGTSTTHHYTLRITFLNKNEAQDDNQGVSFSAKIQINEYNDSVGELPVIESCPDCKYIYYGSSDEGDRDYLTLGEYAKPLNDFQLSLVEENYQTLMSKTGKDYFFGIKLNESTNIIEKIYGCAVYNNNHYCIEGIDDGSFYINNKNYLSSIYGNKCNEHVEVDENIEEDYYHEYYDYTCTDSYEFYINDSGFIGMGNSDAYCSIVSSEYAYCDELAGFTYVHDLDPVCPGPDCKYIPFGSEIFSVYEPLTNQQLSLLKSDYNEVLSSSNYDFFAGITVDPNTNMIKRAYLCGTNSNDIFCVENAIDYRKVIYDYNVNEVLPPLFGEYNESTGKGCKNTNSTSYICYYGDNNSIEIFENGRAELLHKDPPNNSGYEFQYYYGDLYSYNVQLEI